MVRRHLISLIGLTPLPPWPPPHPARGVFDLFFDHLSHLRHWTSRLRNRNACRIRWWWSMRIHHPHWGWNWSKQFTPAQRLVPFLLSIGGYLCFSLRDHGSYTKFWVLKWPVRKEWTQPTMQSLLSYILVAVLALCLVDFASAQCELSYCRLGAKRANFWAQKGATADTPCELWRPAVALQETWKATVHPPTRLWRSKFKLCRHPV